ncbi:MAG TPA: 4-hydroxythreonine-4-phosphate dehydrogenase PdxA [Bacteroidia bacterium]|nr:4-hydroxythreonine-4-phosphate dehydrogenase PdxA [Bacteroidia bacterium]
MAEQGRDGQIKVAITCGDLNGIGLEVVMKTFLDNRMLQVCTPLIYVSSKTISNHRKALALNEFNYTTVRSAKDALLRKVNVVNCWEEEIPLQLGEATEISGRFALRSIDAAVNDLKEETVDVLVTAPVNKNNIPQDAAGNVFTGHTEYLAQKFNAPDYLMFMVSDTLRIALASGHVPVNKIKERISEENISKRVRQMNKTLTRDFGINKPRIAVLGLNPHSGDGGLLGDEEQKIISPAVKKLFDDGIYCFGPYSADGFFGAGTFRQFDAVLAMYHDQGLIPFKTIAFESGVNFTAGLPIVRTSPDHGTAYDIAGKNKASASSLREAVYIACDIFSKRKEYKELSANPLKAVRKEAERG